MALSPTTPNAIAHWSRTPCTEEAPPKIVPVKAAVPIDGEDVLLATAVVLPADAGAVADAEGVDVPLVVGVSLSR